MARLLELGEAIELHCDLVSRYGGQSGIRHTGALRGAVGQRPGTSDVFAIAAGYALDFAATRPFPDANDRAGLVAALVFLDLNGVQIHAADDEFVALVEQIRTRTVRPKDLATFFREHVQDSASSPADAPMGPRAEPSKDRPTSVRELADALADLEDDGDAKSPTG